MNYHRLAFTDIVKDFQELYNSREQYSVQEKFKEVNGLSDNEIGFIQSMDHFFMASIGDNGYPYIQHRGGAPGFVKILDTKTLGLIDFAGNKQYISVGNITSNNNVALIFLSYPYKARLKIYAKVKIVALEENPDLLAQLSIDGYRYRPERMMVFDIQAYDWNCPQHITPRYTIEEIEDAMRKNRAYVERLEKELEQLKAQLGK